MSQVSRQALFKGILGASAVSLTFGAVQLASGRDLGRVSQAPVLQVSLLSAGAGINRAAKADRAAGVSASVRRTQTISLRLDGLSDTSVLVRVPAAHPARDTSFAKPGDRKVACEPVVSVLTEVAKHLEPGRCVT
ncbi:MAG: hypothetical protein P4M05_14035 [Bradyrhizobium sp.]|nr:hypothetical protein [Bradyrhizobium sp.]